MDRPVLALDVDGPIVLFGEHKPANVMEIWVDSIPVTISKRISSRLYLLSQAFFIVWSTSWSRSASQKLAPIVGLEPGLPFIDFDRYQKPKAGQSRKLPGLQAWLGERAAAIVDDEIGSDMEIWAKSREAPTFLRKIDPRHGIQDEDVHSLLEFARQTAYRAPS